MNKKLFFVSIPIVIGPYLALFALATIFFSTKLPFFRWTMEEVFCGNALYLVAAMLIFCVLVVVWSGIISFVSVYKKWDALSVAKTAMIIKLAQIPAYVSIFVLGVLLVTGIFTIPFAIGLFVLDCLFVLMTGLLVISAVVISIRNDRHTFNELFWIVLLQFVFCGDVIASILLYRKLKRSNSGNVPVK